MFIVSSEDMEWTRRNFPPLLSNISDSVSGCKPLVTFSGQSSPAQDMAILASCNHSVITLGTFGWWSAYLAGGVTVYCHKYPPPKKTPLVASRRDMYLPTWIGLS
jgi:galactoside 2-L-fucosyltransferase 1/2